MAKVIMIQGTMSNAGKSLLTAGLCRIMKQDGYRTAPFKSQNMALNSFITEEGLEMGRAQVMQAEAAGIPPLVCMNPILLKPTSSTGSQVIVNGRVVGNMSAREYFSYKKQLIPDIRKAFRELAKLADVIVIEGAGSPAEINLRENDIVNMGLAELVDAPVLLVGDIDRGDRTILDPGIRMLTERGGVPVIGLIPYMELALDDEDSLTERFDRRDSLAVDIAVIRFPRISNFTDLNALEQFSEVSVRYVSSVRELGSPDMIVLPGSKNTMGDLKWMRQNGLEAAVKRKAETIPVFGICGGYQMLGMQISDPEGVEEGGSMCGMELLPVTTRIGKEKLRRQAFGRLNETAGVFSSLSGLAYEGYEIHMGRTETVCGKERQNMRQREQEAAVLHSDGRNVYGTYLHGFFDKGEIAETVMRSLAGRKGISLEEHTPEDYRSFKEKQYDRLADTLRSCLNMEDIYGILREARL